ncbi:MAG TPA: hypothetical protein VLF43_03125, partial [Candidatus Saccharimonadales bacterium]|nr:hypothetical protein [Candidatus Saccharimonadales bacterium]
MSSVLPAPFKAGYNNDYKRSVILSRGLDSDFDYARGAYGLGLQVLRQHESGPGIIAQKVELVAAGGMVAVAEALHEATEDKGTALDVVDVGMSNLEDVYPHIMPFISGERSAYVPGMRLSQSRRVMYRVAGRLATVAGTLELVSHVLEKAIKPESNMHPDPNDPHPSIGAAWELLRHNGRRGDKAMAAMLGVTAASVLADDQGIAVWRLRKGLKFMPIGVESNLFK